MVNGKNIFKNLDDFLNYVDKKIYHLSSWGAILQLERTHLFIIENKPNLNNMLKFKNQRLVHIKKVFC